MRQSRSVVVGGVVLRCCEQRGGGDLAALFVHGMEGNGREWAYQLSRLSSYGRMVTVDLPGFAGTRLPESVRTLSDYAPLVCGLADELGMSSVVLIGHSLGGRIALETVLEYPGRFRGLGLLSSAGTSPPGTRANLNGTVDPGALELLNRLVAQTECMDFRSRLAEITVPTSVIWGRHDRVIPLPIGKALARGIPAANLKVLDEAGHAPHVEQPEGVAAELGRLLDRVGQARYRAQTQGA